MRQNLGARTNLSQILLTAMAKAVIDIGGKNQNKLFVDLSCEIDICVCERKRQSLITAMAKAGIDVGGQNKTN